MRRAAAALAARKRGKQAGSMDGNLDAAGRCEELLGGNL